MAYEINNTVRPSDLRGILKYVPQWRGRTFVIAIDGAIMEDENFANILLDIAVLRSLNIKLVLVAGIGKQLERLAKERNLPLSDMRGEGPTDDLTLRLSIEAAGIVAHELQQGLSTTGLKCAITNAVRATEFGIIGGVDQLWRGKVEKVELSFLNTLIDNDIIPILPALAYSRDGRALRVNSDLLGSELALALRASKLVYLCPYPGLTINGHYSLNVPVEELRGVLAKAPVSIEERVRSKAIYAVKTIDGGVPRVHIMDGRMNDGLLSEIFSKVGVGSMVYGNEYHQIRAARRKDVAAIYSITKSAVKNEALRHRSKQSIERDIDHFYVFEIDESVIACAALFPEGESAEIASVFVSSSYQNRGIGKTLVEFMLQEAARRGLSKVFALTTQAYSFFRTILNFEDGQIETLSAERRAVLEKSGRNSKVLVKRLK